MFSTSTQVTGKVYAADYAAPTPSNLTTAVGDMELAFTDAAGRAPDVTELGAGNIGGMTLAPGVYKWGTGLLIPTDVTLNGSATDVWIFQIAQDLTVAAARRSSSTGGALPKNVFWQVAGLRRSRHDGALRGHRSDSDVDHAADGRVDQRQAAGADRGQHRRQHGRRTSAIGARMKNPRLKAPALQTAWNVLKTTLLPPPPPPISFPSLVPTSAPLLREGELFDDTYRLMRLLGEGSMGAVYEATHARLAGRYAIKLLLLKPTVGSEAIALFDREARITSLLQHPNIVQVIDHNTTADGTEYLVMEYLAGESLAQRLAAARRRFLSTPSSGSSTRSRRGWRPPTPLASFTAISSRTTCSWSGRGAEVESVKILDFGISKVKGSSWGRQAPEGTVMGTPLYMAPEQIEGRVADADGATDQFALAVIAYEMLTGRTPFRADTAGEVFALAVHTDRHRWASGATWSWSCAGAWPSRTASGFPPSPISPTRFAPPPPVGCARPSGGDARVCRRRGRQPRQQGAVGTAPGRALLTCAAAAGIALAFVVGGEVNRRSSAPGTPSLTGRRRASPRPRPVMPAQRNRVTPRKREPKRNRRRPGDAAEPRDEIAVAPERPPPSAREKPPRQVRRPAARADRHLPASVDEDATMPATEPSN